MGIVFQGLLFLLRDASTVYCIPHRIGCKWVTKEEAKAQGRHEHTFTPALRSFTPSGPEHKKKPENVANK